MGSMMISAEARAVARDRNNARAQCRQAVLARDPQDTQEGQDAKRCRKEFADMFRTRIIASPGQFGRPHHPGKFPAMRTYKSI
jgi:hypothetical protein